MELLGIISVVFLVAAIVLLQAIWGPDYFRTYSRLVARKQASIIYYFCVFVIFLSLFSFYITQYFVPQLQLPSLFMIVYCVGVAAQLVCVAVPEVGGRKTKIHIFAAGIMAVSVFLQVLLIPMTITLSMPTLLLCYVSLFVMVTVALLVIMKHRVIRYEFAFQTAYFASYLLVIVSVGYLK